MTRKMVVSVIFFICIFLTAMVHAGQDAVPQKVRDDITKLFQTRDKAVKDKDEELYLQTQLGHIQGGSVSGHMECDKLETEVLCIVPKSDDPEVTCVAFVRQTYYKPDQATRSGYLIYYLVNTTKGWKATKIVY